MTGRSQNPSLGSKRSRTTSSSRARHILKQRELEQEEQALRDGVSQALFDKEAKRLESKMALVRSQQARCSNQGEAINEYKVESKAAQKFRPCKITIS